MSSFDNESKIHNKLPFAYETGTLIILEHWIQLCATVIQSISLLAKTNDVMLDIFLQ